VVSLQITGGNQGFLDWIDAETVETSE
jgi:hypothetical protein